MGTAHRRRRPRSAGAGPRGRRPRTPRRPPRRSCPAGPCPSSRRTCSSPCRRWRPGRGWRAGSSLREPTIRRPALQGARAKRFPGTPQDATRTPSHGPASWVARNSTGVRVDRRGLRGSDQPETTPLEPDLLEDKFYAAGVGNLLTVDATTGERVELVAITTE